MQVFGLPARDGAGLRRQKGDRGWDPIGGPAGELPEAPAGAFGHREEEEPEAYGRRAEKVEEDQPHGEGDPKKEGGRDLT